MVQYTNFYETIKEARMRLEGSLVLYDGEPCYVQYISDAYSDGIFRLYLVEVSHPQGPANNRLAIPNPYDYSDGEDDTEGFTDYLDNWLEGQPKDVGIIRKKMNSPKFNKFRPFPLGMVNFDGRCGYTERGPTRQTYQGLQDSMIKGQLISLDPKSSFSRSYQFRPHILSPDLCNTIKGLYPTYEECVTNLLDPSVLNEAVAFHRSFALYRGPMGMLFLFYKNDCIGFVQEKDPFALKLSRNYVFLNETLQESNIFSSIVIE